MISIVASIHQPGVDVSIEVAFDSSWPADICIHALDVISGVLPLAQAGDEATEPAANDSWESYECDECEFTTRSQGALTMHRRHKHKTPFEDTGPIDIEAARARAAAAI